MTQIPIDFARARRDDGIARAIDHAEAVKAGWRKGAQGYLREFLATRPGPFLAERLREFASDKGFEDPPDGRAWGAVLKDGARSGLIRKVGAGQAKSSNMSLKVLWEAK